MGQQQLLLIVLGVIIVGVAVILGIQYFAVGAEDATKDELVAHTLTIGANAQQWFKKPVAMGGGGLSFTGYVGEFAKLLKLHSSTNGDYTVTTPGAYVRIEGVPKAALGYGTTWKVVTIANNYGMNTVVGTTDPTVPVAP